MQATHRSPGNPDRWINRINQALAVTGNLAALAAWLGLGLCWLVVLATVVNG